MSESEKQAETTQEQETQETQETQEVTAVESKAETTEETENTAKEEETEEEEKGEGNGKAPEGKSGNAEESKGTDGSGLSRWLEQALIRGDQVLRSLKESADTAIESIDDGVQRSGPIFSSGAEQITRFYYDTVGHHGGYVNTSVEEQQLGYGSLLTLNSIKLASSHAEFVYTVDNNTSLVSRFMYRDISLAELTSRFGDNGVRRLFALMAVLSGVEYMATLPAAFDISCVADVFTFSAAKHIGAWMGAMMQGHAAANGAKGGVWAGPELRAHSAAFATEDEHRASQHVSVKEGEFQVEIEAGTPVLLDFGDLASAVAAALEKRKLEAAEAEQEASGVEDQGGAGLDSIDGAYFVQRHSDAEMLTLHARHYASERLSDWTQVRGAQVEVAMRVVSMLPVVLAVNGPAKMILGSPAPAHAFVTTDADVLALLNAVLGSVPVLAHLCFSVHNAAGALTFPDATCLDAAVDPEAGVDQAVVDALLSAADA